MPLPDAAPAAAHKRHKKPQNASVALCNDIGHRKSFAGAGNAQQSLTFIPCFQALHQRFNRIAKWVREHSEEE